MHVRYRLIAAIMALAPTFTIAQSPVAIGIVREDGVLIPVISILGDKHQPLLEEDAVFARTAEALPTSWEFWRIGGRRPITITTTARRMVESHCSEQEVWTTTLKTAATREGASIDKIGVATQGRVTVEHPEQVSSQTQQSSRLASTLIVSTTNSSEARFVRDNPDDQAAAIPATVRARTTVRIEKLMRRQTRGGAIFYFEATKSYGEFVGTRTTGWVRLSANGNSTFGEETSPLSGEAGTVTHQVLGVVRDGSSELWVLQRNGYESESYVVYQWPKGLQLVDLFGGGC
ncbi:MAG: hypothetical protein ACRD1W_01765 [Vicinamibacterales bacterium]